MLAIVTTGAIQRYKWYVGVTGHSCGKTSSKQDPFGSKEIDDKGSATNGHSVEKLAIKRLEATNILHGGSDEREWKRR
jgi:hypothetical protein